MFRVPTRVALVAALLAPLSAAQLFDTGQLPEYSLSTVFDGNTYPSAADEAGNLFDLTVLNPAGLKITAFDARSFSTNGVPLDLDVYLAADPWVDVHTDSSKWVLVSTGSAPTAAPTTHVDVEDFFLAPGTYGIYLVYKNPSATVAPIYTPSGGLAQFANADLHLVLGGAKTGPAFNANPPFQPRIWNGTIHYGYADSAAYGLFGYGCAGSNGTPRLAPVNGDEPVLGSRFNLRVTNLPVAGGPVMMNYGFSSDFSASIPLPIDLGATLGAPGRLKWSDDIISTPLTNVAGTATYGLSVPTSATAVGLLFYNQAFVTDLGVNPGNLTVSNAGVGRMGW